MRDAVTFWDREIDARTHVSWMENEAVRRYVNRSVSGSESASAIDWFQAQFPQRFDRGLSIGCGSGGLERDLVRRGVCSHVDAFDGSIGSLAVAQQEATKAGLAGAIRYFAADFNRPALPGKIYDVVFVHQALHHVAELERLYAAILAALKPSGILYFDEYVGPSRFEWSERLIRPHRTVFESLPPEVRRGNTLLYPIQPDDPSEAYRSSEIVGLAPIGFEIAARRDYGGNLLSVLFPAIDWSKAGVSLVDDLIRDEEKLLQGDARPYHTVVVARARTGPAREAAFGRYERVRRLNRARHAILTVVRAGLHFKRRLVATSRRRWGVATEWARSRRGDFR